MVESKAAEGMAKQREQKKALGLVRFDVWAPKQYAELVKKFAKRMCRKFRREHENVKGN